MSHHVVHFKTSTEQTPALTPTSPQPTSYGTMEYAPRRDIMEYALREDSLLDGSTLYDSDDENPWVPYTGLPYRYYYERRDLESQPPSLCHSIEDYWFIFSYALIWLIVLVYLMTIVGFGFVAGSLVAVGRSVG